MTVKGRYGLVFPLVLAVALGGLSSWLGRISDVNVEEVVLNPKEPQYLMQDIEGKRFDQQGRLKDGLTAQKVWQLPKSKDVKFAMPKLSVYRDDKLQYFITSKEGNYNTDNKKVWFNQDVVLTRPAVGNNPSGVVKTASLDVDTQTEIAQTKDAVQFQYGLSNGTAQGLIYDNKKQFLNLPSRVKAIIYDQKHS